MSKKNLEIAKRKHDAWLLSKGIHISQLKKKDLNVNHLPSYRVEANTEIKSSNTIPTWEPNTYKKSVIEILGDESPQTQAEILEKMSRIQPAFNKGGLQLIPKSDLKTAGKKQS